MSPPVDSYRFLDFVTRQLVRAWIRREPRRAIPWTQPTRPLCESRVALVSTGGLRRLDDRPFDREGERRDPWWGDPSFRTIPRDARTGQVCADHLHVDPRFVAEDLNCALPAERLLALERDGTIGSAAPTHASFMGYVLRPEVLLAESAPAMLRGMRAEEVDVALLAPY